MVGDARSTIEFFRHDLVHLARGTYCWVDVKQFRIAGSGTDRDLLAALIRDRQYHDHYAGQDPIEQAQDELHGPYWLSAITPDVFEPVETSAARLQLLAWAAESEPQPPEVMRELEDKVLSLLDAAVLYRLPDLRSTAEHEWGWVVGQGGFLEYVAIDRSHETITLVVASDD